MEQAQYWMWMKSRQFLKSDFQVWKSSIDDSWEEKAFAEDACGNLGGCIWPPRSYSCSFCKREFRSAQALGGHMNVHRRDRARLKQSLPTPQNDLLQSQSRHILSHNPLTKSFDSSFPAEFCTLDFDSSRVSGISAQENFSDHKHKENPKDEETCLINEHGDYVEIDLLMGFNSPTGAYGDINCKRPKTCPSDRCNFKPVITEANSKSIQDIDLELRLGEPPKVK